MMTGGLINISNTCMSCNATHDVTVSRKAYARYMAGDLVQKVWPTMPADDREVIIGHRSGFYLCGACFDQLGED